MIPKQCMIDAVANSLNNTMMHGGTLKPELYFMYNNESLDYLCYTSEWYKTCTMQKPFLKQQVESEIIKDSSAEVTRCLAAMENKLRNSGYTVNSRGTRKAEIKLVPGKVIITPNISMSVERDGSTSTFDSNRFAVSFDSKAYDIILLASSIQNFEARYGDSIPETYMTLYPNLKVEKKKQDDGTKVYIITARDTLEKLQFATRSLAWPPA
jgi:hypothetical protein